MEAMAPGPGRAGQPRAGRAARRPGPGAPARMGAPRAAVRTKLAAARLAAGSGRMTGDDAAPTRTATAGGLAVPREQAARACRAAARFFGARLAGSWVPGYLAGRG